MSASDDGAPHVPGGESSSSQQGQTQTDAGVQNGGTPTQTGSLGGIQFPNSDHQGAANNLTNSGIQLR